MNQTLNHGHLFVGIMVTVNKQIFVRVINKVIWIVREMSSGM